MRETEQSCVVEKKSMPDRRYVYGRPISSPDSSHRRTETEVLKIAERCPVSQTLRRSSATALGGCCPANCGLGAPRGIEPQL